ncbi:MAG: hypothetical protein K2Z81_02995, partial [Cyanobacteria bacterium]|nr:hypothetical protein [Cyanobacteriota bacterium]
MQSRQVVINTGELIRRSVWLENFGWSHKLPVALLFGCFFGLASSGFDLPWVAWVGLVPLLVLVRGAQSLPLAGLIGLFFGMGYNGVALSSYIGLAPLTWLGVHEIVGTQFSIIIWLLESFHQTILMVIFSLMVFSLPMRPGFLPHFQRPFFPYLLSVPILWVFLAWSVATSELFIGLPINQLAYSQYKQLPLIQIASFGGAGLLDFFIVLVNAVLASLIFEFANLVKKLGERTDRLETKAGSVLDGAIVLVSLILVCTWGGIRLQSQERQGELAKAWARDSQSPPVAIAVVQGNVSIEEERLKVTKPKEIADRYKSLCDELGAAIVFLPEGVVNSSQMAPGYLLSVLNQLSGTQKKEVLFGSIETLQNGLANAARLVSPFKPERALYIKRRLVPLGESAPIGVLNEQLPAPVRERIPATREAFLSSSSTHLVKSGWG